MASKVLRVVGRTAWIIPAIVGLGILSWVSYLYPGIKMRSKLWLAFAAVFVVLAVAEIAFLVTAGPSSDPVAAAKGTSEVSALGGAVIVVTWLAGMIVFVILLPRWIKWTPTTSDPSPAAVAPAQISSPFTDTSEWLAPTPPTPPPPTASVAVEPAVPSRTGKSIDVNTATVEELNSIPGLPAGDGYVMMHERNTRGPFRDLGDLLQRVPMEPHVAAQVKDGIRFGPEPTAHSRGRIVDL